MTTMRSALRGLLHSKRLSGAAVACIGLGAAATASVATLVGATLLRPLPFPDADRLVRIWFEEDGENPRVSLSIPELREAAALSCFDAFLATARMRMVALFERGAERMRGEAVTPRYFELLGVRPLLGRFFVDSDHVADAQRVMVVTHRTWTSRYGADPEVVGKALRTERTAYTIVGVAPPEFGGTVEDDAVEFWVPLEQYDPAAFRQDRNERPGWAIGRLREGVSLAAAEGQVAAFRNALAEQHPDVYRRLRTRLEPMGENWRSGFRRSGLLLSGAALLLLLVAATNVAGLLLARVLERRRELAVRAALGASRRRLVAQLLVEALLLVAAGGIVGVLAAPHVLAGFLALSPVAVPHYVRLEPDATALLLSVVALGITGILAGVAPALVGSRVGPSEALKESGRGAVGSRAERRWGSALVAAEAALTLMLLVGGGLLLRSWERLGRIDLGYRIDGIARLAVAVSGLDVRESSDLPPFYERLHAAMAEYPGVVQVGLVWPTLPPWDAYRNRVRFDGLEGALAEEGVEMGVHLADPGLLPTLGIPVLAGRNIEGADGAGTGRVAVVSRALAERMGGVERALGREVTLPEDPDPRMPSGRYRVVGVAENVAYDAVDAQDTRRYIRYGDAADTRATRLDLYLPLAQSGVRTVSIGVFTHGDPAAMIEPLRRRIAEIAPSSAVHWTSTMAYALEFEYAASRFYALLVTAFSLSALALTGVGLFAVLSHGVARRTGEIGLRVALGATPRHVAGLVLAMGLRPLAIGVAAGLAGAAVTARLMGGLLYGIPALDGPAFLIAAGTLLLVALPAGVLPARRATALDPMRALREE
jgi:putative ABC transport system permease protein